MNLVGFTDAVGDRRGIESELQHDIGRRLQELTNRLPSWFSDTWYDGGEQVRHNGHPYEATGESCGVPPDEGTASAMKCWQPVRAA